MVPRPRPWSVSGERISFTRSIRARHFVRNREGDRRRSGRHPGAVCRYLGCRTQRRALAVTASARGARIYVQHARDPMQTTKRHFAQLVDWLGYSLAIVIDDLDRCEPTSSWSSSRASRRFSAMFPSHTSWPLIASGSPGAMRSVRRIRRCVRRAGSPARISVSREDLPDDAPSPGAGQDARRLLAESRQAGHAGRPRELERARAAAGKSSASC